MRATGSRGRLAATVPVVLAAILSWTAVAAAQAPPEGAPPAASATLTPPALLTRVEAVYPPEARSARREATVSLELVVAADGTVADARVVTPAGHGFDEAAVAAARAFTFAPARRNGVPIRSSVQLAYEFHAPAPPTPVKPPAPPAPLAPLAPAPEIQRGADQATLVVAKGPVRASIQEPESLAASDSSTERRELALRPRMRAEGVLESVPGLFTVQHAGGGKSQQYFLRGFDLDHGTDFAVFVDGLPVNAVSHAHGQGYADMHFLIAETIDTIESTKGPYSARVGDFATAGSISFHMADHLDESLAKAEIGPNGYKRAVVVESPNLGDKWRMVLAAEIFNEDGPFIHPESFDRFNGYVKVTRVLDARSELSLMLMGYGGSWNMSGVLPARAVCGEGDGTPTPLRYAGSRCINRWDSVDPSQGGASQRFMALTSYARRLDDGDLEATIFGLHSNLQLFPNDGIASSLQPAGMQYGSQIEQDDARTEIGASFRLTKRVELAGMKIRSTVGLQFRYDGVDSQLHRDEQRQRLDGMPGIPGPITDSGINETELGAFFEEDWRPVSWLRFVLGGRADRVDADVSNLSPVAIDKVSGYKGTTQLSPKATMVVSPVAQLDLFANYGRGFHSNDVRTILPGAVSGSGVFAPAVGASPALLATAVGYEVGATVRPVEGLSVSGAFFLLDLTSEQTIDGDSASTAPSSPTRRYGVEVSGRYNFRKDIYADASFTVAHARYTDGADIAAGTSLVTLAPVRTFAGGLGVREPVGPVTIIGSAYVRSMSDRPATQDGKLVATGFTTLNAELGLRWRFVEVAADVLNVGDLVYREGQFAVSSRLPGEKPNPPQGISFTPGIPRTGLVHAIVYW
jgi:TonB family protein